MKLLIAIIISTFVFVKSTPVPPTPTPDRWAPDEGLEHSDEDERTGWFLPEEPWTDADWERFNHPYRPCPWWKAHK